ncbi:MAG: sialate O-acetylesterase [Planctomycetota bacterium]|jgi:alpha-galactosidase
MTTQNRIKTILNLTAAVAMVVLVLPTFAKEIPAQLPDPDGKAPDTTKPVKVYILAGQSNMVGMGNISGARCRYTGIYLTADPAAPKGPMYIYPVGNYKISPHGIYVSADPKADNGAMVSIYKGAYDPATDYDKAKPVKIVTVALGVVQGVLPSISGPHTHVVRGYVDVPEFGTYSVNAGYGESSYNVMELDGQEVYRKNVGEHAVRQKVVLEAGKRYAVKITYFKGGSTALWMSQEDLLGKGDLEIVTKREKKFPNLIDDKGEWTVRKDVYFQEARLGFKGAPLTVPPLPGNKTIGPELQFGHIMGYYHDEQVLVIKTAQGNRSLGYDFRPPSSGRNDPNSKWESLEYRLMIEGVRKTLDDIENIVLGYKEQGYEIAGFAWWQGHKDGFSSELITEYEQNLVNLIKDVREEFKAPDMPAVIATVGFGGYDMAEKYLSILKAQMAVSDPKKHPEFAGTVASVDTRDFWREIDESPVSQDYHYNRNAETYLLVGDALGRAMVRLLGGNAEAPGQGARPQPVAQQASPEPAEQDEAAAKAALAPIIMDGMVQDYIADPRNNAALLSEASGEKPNRSSQFLRGAMYRLTSFYRTAGVHDYDWHVFGPDLRNMRWDYFSFDPKETKSKNKGGRFRKVTYPEGMENWFASDFNAKKAGFKSGLPPFGQLDGKPAPLRDSCNAPFCGCGETPKTLWEKEVILVRGTFEIPPLKEGHRYRLVVGGSAHVNAGEGYAIYVNGKLLAQSSAGVGKRQGGQPRGGYIYNDFRDEFKGGKVTIAATSFLRYNNPRGIIPPNGHLTLWMEEAKIPPLDRAQSQ